MLKDYSWQYEFVTPLCNICDTFLKKVHFFFKLFNFILSNKNNPQFSINAFAVIMLLQLLHFGQSVNLQISSSPSVKLMILVLHQFHLLFPFNGSSKIFSSKWIFVSDGNYLYKEHRKSVLEFGEKAIAPTYYFRVNTFCWPDALVIQMKQKAATVSFFWIETEQIKRVLQVPLVRVLQCKNMKKFGFRRDKLKLTLEESSML